ncbi:MaoC family dehydratase [Eilatimonas milleporae]|uniref:Acyl dehydratase n=1 Tax=Eilatimonas milleporae TaxID=911205 RepID=A0A3M0CUW3_9PROT|nr:MaoC family dehydratase [Eilatimonas milleporae]RMB12330.1 acyl dehydratase [Eilatimonas milleporae]
MFKIFYEDIEIGVEETYGNYAVTREEVIDFAGKYDPQPFHLNDDIAKQSVFGALCASGWHTCAMAMRIMVDRMMAEGFAGMGSPGVDNIRWKKPVFPGDTLSVRMRTTEKRPSASRPNIGLIKGAYEVLNQKDEVVMTMETNAMVLRRTPAAG